MMMNISEEHWQAKLNMMLMTIARKMMMIDDDNRSDDEYDNFRLPDDDDGDDDNHDTDFRRTLASQPTSRMQEMGSIRTLFGRSLLLMLNMMIIIMVRLMMMVMVMMMLMMHHSKVKWATDNLDGYLNFYSVSGDGRLLIIVTIIT